MKKIILGLVGEIASGKDTFADYVATKYNVEKISFSQPLRDILEILDLSCTRENLAILGDDLRQRFGNDVLAKSITAKAIKSKADIVILPNIRLDCDIQYLKDVDGFILVGIETNQKTRWERLVNRGQNDDDKTKTWEQFLKDAEHPNESSIRNIIKKAAYTINNDGDLSDFYTQIDELMTSIINEQPN